jgi:hypothetical protein
MMIEMDSVIWMILKNHHLIRHAFLMSPPQNSELIRFRFLAKKPNLISEVMKMYINYQTHHETMAP